MSPELIEQRSVRSRAVAANELALAAAEYLLQKLSVQTQHLATPDRRGNRAGDYFQIPTDRDDVFQTLGPAKRSPSVEPCEACGAPLPTPYAEFPTRVLFTHSAEEIIAKYCSELLDRLAEELNGAGGDIVTFDLPLPDGVDDRDRVVVHGLALRYASHYEISTDTFARRFDVLWTKKP